jgi:PASTA domain-containing protein
LPQVAASAQVTRPRERMAPEVVAMDGAGAVALVRARGFIAAIESVPSELPEGMVIEQEPPAGVGLKREAVITLRLATTPCEVCDVGTDGEREATCQEAPHATGRDDTDAWFQVLALGRVDRLRAEPSGRRRRKHRHSRPATAFVFDPAPAPRVRRAPPDISPLADPAHGRAGVWAPLASTLYALPLTFAGLPWRRGTAVAFGLLLCVMLGMRVFASGERRMQSAVRRPLARIIRPPLMTGEPVSRNQPVQRRTFHSRRRRRARQAPTERARAASADAVPPPAVVAGNAAASRPQAAPAATATPDARAQFAYLGQ